MTEQQKYEVVEVSGNVELRRYERCTVADVVMTGSADRVGNKAFGPLVRYISAKQISMTAPVLQAASSETDAWVVSFVLPGGKGIGDYPLPDDAQLTLREIPSHIALAARWSGRWTYSSVMEHEAELRRLLAGAGAGAGAGADSQVGNFSGYEAVGPAVWARYDPPWKPWFLRRNEVLLEVQLRS